MWGCFGSPETDDDKSDKKIESTVPPPVSAPVSEPVVAVPPPQPTPLAQTVPLQPPPPPINSMPRTSSNSSGTPVTAIAIMDRNPSAYDQKFLAFKAGDVIRVTKQNEDGLWEGEGNGKSGLFPFNHVKVQTS